MQNKFFYIRQPLGKFIFNLLVGNWEKNIELIKQDLIPFINWEHYQGVMAGYGLILDCKSILYF